jgi:molybdopterin biosynthesis enzyme MoaB
MILKRSCTFALLLGLIWVARAAPAVMFSTRLVTPPLAAEGQNVLECHLINVSDEVRTAAIEVLAQDGTVLATGGGTLNPGDATVTTVPPSASARYCRFLVEGWRAHFRGSIVVRMPGLGSLSALPAQ